MRGVEGLPGRGDASACRCQVLEAVLVRRRTQQRSVVDDFSSNDRPTDNDTNHRAGQSNLSKQAKAVAHLSAEVLWSSRIAPEVIWASPYLGLAHRYRILTQPVHAVFVIEPVFIGVRIRWRRDDKPELMRQGTGINRKDILGNDTARRPLLEHIGSLRLKNTVETAC